MSDEPAKDSAADALSRSIAAEEYEIAGRRVRRAGVRDLKALRDDLDAEDRSARRGNVLQRAMIVAPRRG